MKLVVDGFGSPSRGYDWFVRGESRTTKRQASDDLRELKAQTKELSVVKKQRDELLAALEKLTDVFANIGITSGLYDDEQDALKSACAAIASVKGQK